MNFIKEAELTIIAISEDDKEVLVSDIFTYIAEVAKKSENVNQMLNAEIKASKESNE